MKAIKVNLRDCLQKAVFVKDDMEKLNAALDGTGILGLDTRPMDDLIKDISRKLDK